MVYIVDWGLEGCGEEEYAWLRGGIVKSLLAGFEWE